jgi:hypothetical protein
VSDTKHVVLIHGSWSRGEQWAPARAAFEERGYTVHTPTLRYHELPSHEGAMKIALLSLRDYTDDLVALVPRWTRHPFWSGTRWAVSWSSWSRREPLVPAWSRPARRQWAPPG